MPAEALTQDERARLLPSLSTREQLDEAERIAICAARSWALRPAVLRRDDLLSEKFCLELHRRMFGSIWRGSGRYRTVKAGQWEAAQVPEGMRMFLDDAEGWIRYSTYPVHEAAVRLHHRLSSIQPWQNGSRRHARLLADVVVAANAEAPLSWGAREPEGAAARYAEACRAADGGDLGPLVEFARG